MSLLKLCMKAKSMSIFNVSQVTVSQGLLSEFPWEEQEPNGPSPKQILANKPNKVSEKHFSYSVSSSRLKILHCVTGPPHFS